jgi:soluble lytic murein transglycosylase-like protein
MVRRTLILGLVCSLGLSGCASRTTAEHSDVPKREIKQLVVQEARNLGVSPSLALAMAYTESRFNPNALSHKGARGVMQIMPATARGEYGIKPDALWNPRLNVRLGLHFMRRLIDRYQGRIDLALSYYNGGSAVGDLPNARVIPATRRYVSQVLKLQRSYRTKLLSERT